MKPSSNLLFCSPYFWKKIFLYNKHPIYKVAEKKILSRSSVIPKTLISTYVRIYAGKAWRKRRVNKWMVGFKFGEFTWNRRLALYKAKKARRKNKKKGKK